MRQDMSMKEKQYGEREWKLKKNANKRKEKKPKKGTEKRVEDRATKLNVNINAKFSLCLINKHHGKKN